MNKRQSTLLQSDDKTRVPTARLRKTVRTHVLDKANSLQQDIASLDDPSITELFQLLTTQLQTPSQPDQKGRPTTTDSAIEETTSTENSNVATWPGSKPNKSDVALYVHNITNELKNICVEVDLKFLAYLVDMARVEANSILAQQTGEPAGSPASSQGSRA